MKKIVAIMAVSLMLFAACGPSKEFISKGFDEVRKIPVKFEFAKHLPPSVAE